ncbi:MAG: DUF2628 domain-containing protein [Burkholderiales bacterium]|nr:DUF2628 domain-containing protein [Burkholderiales bacterium]
MICSQCDQSNSDSAKFCSGCGAELSAASNAVVSAANDSEAFYKAAVGAHNQAYYLRRFSEFDAAGKAGASWHWPAFFISFYWLLYRKMWLYALIYFVLTLLLFLLNVAGAFTNSGIREIALILCGALWILPPIYANALYYNRCKKNIVVAKASSPDPQKQLAALSAKGGVSQVALVVLLFFVISFIVGIIAAIALPAYQDYTARAHLATAKAIGRSAATSAMSYYYEHERFPASLQEAGFTTPLSPTVKAINLNARNGAVSVTLSGSRLIEGRVLLFTPSVDLDNPSIGECTIQNDPADRVPRYFPPPCSRQP